MQNILKPFRAAGGDNVFYLHIPKTAGSVVNKLFAGQYGEGEALTHIESKDVFGKDGCMQDISCCKYLSGHITYPLAKQNIDLSRWISLCTFRRPEEQLASHISWVRLLAEPGHEARLACHTDSVKDIVDRIKDVDLSSASRLGEFIAWLENNRHFVFHNTQTRYLCGGKAGVLVEPKLLQQALTNLDAIDFVGTVERLDEFILMLADMLHLRLDEGVFEKANVNSERFGLDLTDGASRKVIEPLIAFDQLIYLRARERFIDQYHSFLASLEKSRRSRYTSVNVAGLKKDIIENKPRY